MGINASSEQSKLLVSAILSAVVFALPRISQPLVFLLLVFLYAVVIRLILSVLVVACSFVDGPVQAVPWLYPIPLSIIVVMGMIATNGWHFAMTRLTLVGEGLIAAGKLALNPVALIVIVPCLIGLGLLEHRALQHAQQATSA
jgi:hypothetical protein